MVKFDVTPATPALGRPSQLGWLLYAAGGVAGVVLMLAFPLVSGVQWQTVVSTVRAVPAAGLAVLGVLWTAGLFALSLNLAAALPGLTHRRALLLSVTGSAVANVLPLGGAAGVALNYRMTRSWGFSWVGFASYTVVTNLWDVLARLLLAVLLLPLVLFGMPLGTGLTRVIIIVAVVLILAGGLTSLLIVHPRAAARLGTRVEEVRVAAAAVVLSAWRRLSVGMALYTTLLGALLVACLDVTGAEVPWSILVLGFCVERLATFVGFTPGGLGIVEVSLTSVLMLAPGVDAAGVAAGVLLYRGLTYGLVIPVGGLLIAGWSWRQRAAG